MRLLALTTFCNVYRSLSRLPDCPSVQNGNVTADAASAVGSSNKVRLSDVGKGLGLQPRWS